MILVDSHQMTCVFSSSHFKQWMYLIPLGLIVMNVMTQAMNMPEEQAAGYSNGQQAGAPVQRGQPAAVRRR